MSKVIVVAILVAAAVQFLPAEFAIVAALTPVGFAIGRPIARVVEGFLGFAK
jgi:uncharacterized protein (DUF697 family)